MIHRRLKNVKHKFPAFRPCLPHSGGSQGRRPQPSPRAEPRPGVKTLYFRRYNGRQAKDGSDDGSSRGVTAHATAPGPQGVGRGLPGRGGRRPGAEAPKGGAWRFPQAPSGGRRDGREAGEEPATTEQQVQQNKLPGTTAQPGTPGEHKKAPGPRPEKSGPQGPLRPRGRRPPPPPQTKNQNRGWEAPAGQRTSTGPHEESKGDRRKPAAERRAARSSAGPSERQGGRPTEARTQAER